MFSKKFDQEFVTKLLKEKEGVRLEFKQRISSQTKIAKTLSAMANTEGGLLLIGTSDQRRITGIDPEEERYMVQAANQAYCVPKASLELQEVAIAPDHPFEEEKYVLLVVVHRSEGPTIRVLQADGTHKAYRRVGDQSLGI
jgi:predicted HTH transcriptional regulator